MNRRSFLKVSAAGTAAAYLATRARFLRGAYAKTPQPLVWLPGSAIPQFNDPLPDLVLVDGTTDLTIRMQEFLADVMPSNWAPAVGAYGGTYVWGYQTEGYTPPAGFKAPFNTYINPVVLATRHVPTQITWVNDLPTGANSQTYWEDWTDLTLHWANPDNLPMMMVNPNPPPAMIGNNAHYNGAVPVVPHLHGGEVPPVLDGGPDAWYAKDGTTQYQGHGYWTFGLANQGDPAPGNYAIYRYPNTQEAANIWFHDHALGITRINVYAGIAGAYLLSDPGLSLPTGLGAHSIGPSTSPRTIIPLVIQDRMFDVDGQLYFPNVGDNPLLHPFWAPEFLGDTIVVNGKVWPFKNLDNNRHRFLFLNGSNARAYEMFLVDTMTDVMGPPMWVIGTDGGYLDTPVKIDPNDPTVPPKLVMMPGERYDVIIDFNDPTWKQNISTAYLALGLPDPTSLDTLPPNNTISLVLRNTGRTPYPFGVTPTGSTLGRVMLFNITFSNTEGSDGYNPDPQQTGGGADLRPAMVRLTTPTVTRQLTLNEVMGPLGPYEALVNNTKWDGHSVHKVIGTVNGVTFDADGVRSDFVVGPDGHTYYSELPQEGVTELWEVINMTADAHPIHLHLVQFQLLDRQKFNVNKYVAAYDALFPGSAAIDPATGLPHPPGVFIGGYGPPLPYDGSDPLSGGKLGGNPDVGALRRNKPLYLQGPAMPPLPQENGWKDTVIMYPGEVTRILVRWAPTDLATNTPAADLHFPFDPNGGHGFVWHCHIIDHEDNEMMRPNSVDLNPAAPAPANRPLKKGTDY